MILEKRSTLIHIPHSGVQIPTRMGFLVNEERIQEEVDLLTDWHTDEIFDIKGIDKIIFPFSRVFCDVERFTEGEEMERVGMGYIYTKCDDGSPLRNKTKKLENIVLEEYYYQHHKRLEKAIEKKITETGKCHIIDAHSFSNTPFQRDINQTTPRPDICIGTNKQNTPQYITDYLVSSFEKHNLNTKINNPYSGSMIPMKYVGDKRVTTIMIEINRDLYKNETKTINRILKDIL